uniref:Peptidase M14 domain-containing protein n=1 Tax=Timema cristinae TaxID=61476 RepID=A0A7R9H1C2_TIMCR|nr:unnamed protein product [Timema cristinae]
MFGKYHTLCPDLVEDDTNNSGPLLILIPSPGLFDEWRNGGEAVRDVYNIGYEVFRVYPTDEQLQLLYQFQERRDYNIWSEAFKPNLSVDIMVAPINRMIFQKFLQQNYIKYEIKIKDVHNSLEDEQRSLFRMRSRSSGVVSQYYQYDWIQSYLRRLENKYRNLVRVESIGKTYEGRDILVIQISTDRSARRPIVLIDAGIHAREWIAPSMALYIINRLVENQVDTEELVAKVDWHIIPVINPDGYEYTHTKVKVVLILTYAEGGSGHLGAKITGTDCGGKTVLKSRTRTVVVLTQTGTLTCTGMVGASSDPCEDTFSGTKGFSEAESQALQKYALKYKKRIKMYLTLHCYGNLILYPWGFTKKLPENWKDLHDLAVKASEAHVKAGGEKYIIGSSTNVLYPAAGGSDDWMKGVIGVDYSYTIEMTQTYGGFIMSSVLINETVVRFFEAIRVFGKFVADMEPN